MVYYICTFFSTILMLYSLTLWIRAILSWFPETRSNAFISFIYKITEPVLNFFRKLRRKNSASRFDFSFLLAFMVISILRSILSVISLNGRITVWYILAIIIQEVWAYTFRFIFIILLIILGIRMIMGFSKKQPNYLWITRLNTIIRTPVNLCYKLLSPLYKLFSKGREPTEQGEIVMSFVFYLLIYIIMRVGVSLLTTFLITL